MTTTPMWIRLLKSFTNNKVQEKNEPLAVFMNLERRKETFSEKEVWVYKEAVSISDELDFHKRADWLIHVWYKFRDLAVSEENEDKFWDHRELICSAFSSGTFTNLYDSLVNAVQWYNSIKQK